MLWSHCGRERCALLCQRTITQLAVPAPVEKLDDEASSPPQQSIWRDYRHDCGQTLMPQGIPHRSPALARSVRETQLVTVALRWQQAVVLAASGEDLCLVAIDPTSEHTRSRCGIMASLQEAAREVSTGARRQYSGRGSDIKAVALCNARGDMHAHGEQHHDPW